MMRFTFRSFAFALAAVAACSPDDGGGFAIRAATQQQAIQGGTLDQSDSNVVAIVINAGGGIAICTGSLIAPNLVLSAHHCVADPVTTGCSTSSFSAGFGASAFRVTTSYNQASTYFNQGVIPTVDNSTWFGVRQVWTPNNNICGGDMSLLELSSPITSVCPLVPRVDTAVASSEGYRATGFGVTSPSGQSAGTRYNVTGLSVICAGSCGFGMSATLEWEGGTNAAKGTCEGDSGGPALDSQGRVIGTVSRGPANSCNDTVYESVFGNAAWIKQQAMQAATDGQYSAPAWATGASTAGLGCGGSGGGSGGGGGTGGGTSGTGGGGTSGTGGGSTSGGCADASLQCTDASGQGDYACVDPTTGGFPANALACGTGGACPTGYSCWSSGTRNRCLQDCGASSGTGGGGQSGTGGGTTGTGGGQSGTGGGTSGSGGGTSGTGGGTHGTGGGTHSSGGGQSGIGGGQSGTGGGSTSGSGGGTAGTAGGEASNGGGDTAMPTDNNHTSFGNPSGCGCGSSDSTLPFAFAAMLLMWRRRVRMSEVLRVAHGQREAR